MKNAALSIFCALISACSSPDATPVDMEYNVSVETLEDTCENNRIPEGLTVTLNVALQTDGSMSITYPTGYIPGSGNYNGLVITDGNTGGSLTTEEDGPALSVTGNLTMDSADLVFEGQRLLLQNDGSEVLCAGNTKLRLKGAARPFWTMSAALDGKYEAYYNFYGQVCPPAQPYDSTSWTVPLDIKEYGGSTFFAFDSHDEKLIFEMETETLASGQVDWHGPMYLIVPAYDTWYEFEGSVTGNFVETAYKLQIKFHTVGDSTGCDFVLDAAGGKRTPNPANVPNVYRLAFLESDACEPNADGSPKTKAFEQEGDVVLRTDSKLTLMYGNKRFDLDPETAHKYTRHWMGGGRTLDFTLSVVPPLLSLSYAWGEPTSTGMCYTSYTAFGVPRYFPDLKLNAPTAETELRMTGPAPSVTDESGPRVADKLAATLKERSARLRPLSEAPRFVREATRTRR